MSNGKTIPPRLATKFLLRFLRDDLVEEVQGDLEEKFFEMTREGSLFRARVNYWFQVLNYFRPFAIRKMKYTFYQPVMYKSYFKIGWRNLVRDKGYSFINVSGLAVGMAVAMMIGLWIYDECSYESTFPNKDRIVQVMQHQTINGYKVTDIAIPIPLEEEIRTHYGNDFKYLVLSSWVFDQIVAYGDKKIFQSGCFMGEDAPELLSLQMLRGTRAGLHEAGSIFLCESAAKALFGDREALNQIIRLNDKLDLKVTGVYQDIPFNSRFSNLMVIAPWQVNVQSQPWVKEAAHQWNNNSFQLFAQLADHAKLQHVNERIKNAKLDNLDENDRKFQAEVFLWPMKNWHLRFQWDNGVNSGLIQYVWLFGMIGTFVLLLACINFMNLSTARSEKRAREVGIRKSMGSVRSQLIGQFLSESMLVVVLAFFGSVIMVMLCLPAFNQLTEKRIVFPWGQEWFWMGSFAFVVMTGFLAGSYPALYLSSFQPVKVLKGVFKSGRFASLPRKILVVLQFSVSLILILGTIIVYQQIRFTKNRPMGYDHKNMMMIMMQSPDFKGKYDVLRNELKSAGAIQEMTESSSPLTGVWSNSGSFTWEGKDPDLQGDFGTIFVTHDYGNTVSWHIAEGRDFDRKFPSDSSGVVLNETAVKFMGLKNPIGKTIHWGDNIQGKTYTIIGVVKDMLMGSPFRSVKQTFYFLKYDDLDWISLKLNPAKSTSESIMLTRAVFQKYLPNVPFDFKFADDEHAKKFETEERIGKLAAIFSALAIFISCLGLFGLASFVAEQRTKEIGIRKVMGASVEQVWRMLSLDFVILVIISGAIATPIAYFFLKSWLEGYSYRIEISWWIFVIAFAGGILITLVTVSYQAIRAGLTNPVKSLRSE